MQIRLFLLSLFLLPFTLVACGGATTHESLAKDIDKTAGELVEVLEGITDKESADAAKGKLNKIAERFAAMMDEAKELGNPSPEVDKKLKEKYAGANSNTSKLQKEMMRVAMIPGTQEALQDFGKAMQNLR